MNDMNKLWAKVVAKAWGDAEYKQRLISDPIAVLRSENVEIPDYVKIRVLEEAPNEEILVIPHMEEGETNLDNLEERVAASIWC